MSSSTIITIPANDADFEEKCVPLFAALLGDPNVKVVGTKGGRQSGLDLTGRRNRDAAQLVGIQCKLVTRGARLTEAIIRKEASEALKVTPALAEFVIVTTARDDPVYDSVAAAISQEEADKGRQIDVQVWGWDTLQIKIRAHKAALDAFDPGHSASTDYLISLGEENLSIQMGAQATAKLSLEMQRQVLEAVQSIQVDTSRGSTLETHIDVQIDEYRDLLNEGSPRTALRLLQKLDMKLTDDNSAAIRARVRANIGLAHQRLGDEAKAGEMLLAAYEINPDDPRVATNRALGLQLLGRPEESAVWALERLKNDPTDIHAAGFLYQAATLSEEHEDPTDAVPSALLEVTLVRLYRSTFLRARGLQEEWRDLAIRAWREDPTDTAAVRLAGEAFLETAIGDGRFERSAYLEPSRRNALRQAVELLQGYWEEARKFENASEHTYVMIGCNLVTAYRASMRGEDALRVANEVIGVAPNDQDALACAAQAALDLDNHDQALLFAKQMTEGPFKTITLLYIWSATSEWSCIAGFANKERREVLSDEPKAQYDAMVFRARNIEEPQPTLQQDARALMDRWPASLVVQVTIADACRCRDAELHEKAFSIAITLAQGQVNLGHRMMLANLCLLTDRWMELVETLDGYVALDEDTVQLSWLALGHANSEARTRASRFFRSLPAKLLLTAKYARLAGALEHNRGDVGPAIQHLRTAVADDPSDLRAHLLLHSALERSNRPLDAAKHVRALDEATLMGQPQDRMRLALLLRRIGESARALEIGFDVASNNRHEREIVSFYPGLVLTDEGLPDAVSMASGMDEEFWFKLTGAGTEDPVEGILSNQPVPEAQNFPRAHMLSSRLRGKRLGDEIVLPQNIGPVLRYTLTEAKHKYIWLLHDIMHTHGSRFPEETALFTLRMQEGDVSPILEIAKQASERDRSLIDVYLENPIPLTAIAPMGRKNVVDMADQLIISEHDLRTCIGLEGERLEAESAVLSARQSGAVIDALTLWRAHRVGILVLIKEWFGELFIAQTTFDEFIQMRAKAEFSLNRDINYLGIIDGKPVRTEQTQEDALTVVELIDEAILTIEDVCTVLPADDDGVDWRSTSNETSLLFDPIRLAKERSSLFLSDELNARQIAAQLGVARCSWLQIVIKVMLAEQETEPATYHLATARLAAARHGHVSLTAATLMGILQLENENSFAYFRGVSRYIGGPKAEMISHIEAVKSFAILIFGANIPTWQKGRAFGVLLERLIAERRDWGYVLTFLHRGLIDLSAGLAAATWACEYLEGWIRYHFLNPQAYESMQPGSARARKRWQKRRRGR